MPEYLLPFKVTGATTDFEAGAWLDKMYGFELALWQMSQRKKKNGAKVTSYGAAP